MIELPSGDFVELPVAVLPTDVQEGSWLRLVIDDQATLAARAEAEARLARLRERANTGDQGQDIEL